MFFHGFQTCLDKEIIIELNLNNRGNCVAITSHHCNEVGDLDTPPVDE